MKNNTAIVLVLIVAVLVLMRKRVPATTSETVSDVSQSVASVTSQIVNLVRDTIGVVNSVNFGSSRGSVAGGGSISGDTENLDPSETPAEQPDVAKARYGRSNGRAVTAGPVTSAMTRTVAREALPARKAPPSVVKARSPRMTAIPRSPFANPGSVARVRALMG